MIGSTSLSLALLVATLVLWDQSWTTSNPRKFHWRNTLWTAAIVPGQLRLDNKAQRLLESEKIAAERRHITKALEREAYGSDAYRRALAEAKAFDAAGERRMAAIPPVERSISIPVLIAWCAFLPALYCGHWLFRRRRGLIEQFRGRFALVALVFLALCTTLIVFWARSNQIVLDQLVYGDRSSLKQTAAFVALRSYRGRVVIIWAKRSWDDQEWFDADTADDERETPNGLTWRSKRCPSEPSNSSFFIRQGFSINFGSERTPRVMGGSGTFSHASIGLPHWFLLLLLAIPMALTLRRRFRKARYIRDSLCEKCGYDVRHSPERCPECGNPAMNRQLLTPSCPPGKRLG